MMKHDLFTTVVVAAVVAALAAVVMPISIHAKESSRAAVVPGAPERPPLGTAKPKPPKERKPCIDQCTKQYQRCINRCDELLQPADPGTGSDIDSINEEWIDCFFSCTEKVQQCNIDCGIAVD